MIQQDKEKEFYTEAFSRNKGIISVHLQEKLKNTRIAICGMGGAGEIHAETLARIGIGSLTIADGDTFEVANINRQMEAMTSTVGKSKEEVIALTLKDINPYISVRTTGYITEENVDAFLEGADIVVDGMDFFKFDIRRCIFNRARELGIPVITAAPIGFGSSVIVFTKDSMSFDDYFNVDDSTQDELKPLLFGIGLAPSLLQRSYFAPEKIKTKEQVAPSSVLGTLAAADWMGTIVCKLVDTKEVEVAPVSFHFDPYVTRMKRTHLYFGNRNIIQRIKMWYLTKKLLKK
jgi:molybdopterin/thiamine biosynthesis adenylyltransferase